MASIESPIYNQEGEKIGMIELPANIFGLKWNADLVHQVITSQAANLRQPVAHVKSRGEVRGGGRKPWRQKGTGRARHGSIRSPLWKGGGVTHGPTKVRSFKKKINKKMAARALATVLSAKAREREILVVEDLKFSQPKTKAAAKVFENFSRIKSFADITAKPNRVLLALAAKDESTIRASRNLPYADVEEVRNITVLDVLNRKYLVIPKEAVTVLEKRLTK